MIPRIAGRGQSFKGAGLYYLHDVEADTSERVAWTHTRNVPTDDPEKALKWMAWTDMNRNSLKALAGVPGTGQKAHAGNVFTYSLSWSPEEEPNRETMLGAALETLELLELDRHEVLIVAHNDKHYKHLHVIANLVSPEDGRIQAPAWSKLKMSGWAEEFERVHNQGEVLCEQRAKNNARRRNGELVKHEPEKHVRAALVEQLYTSSDSGRAFAAALEEHGYTLALGDRRSYVLVDEAGEIYCLSRQLKGIKGHRARDLKAKLAVLKEERDPLPRARDLTEQRQVFDRDAYEIERQKQLVDAAIEEEGQRGDEGERGESSSGGALAGGPKSFAETLDPIREREAQEQRIRAENEAQMAAFYRRDELAAELVRKKAVLAKNQGIRGKVTGRKKELEAEITALQKNLDNVDHRIEQQRRKIEIQIAQKRASDQIPTQQAPSPANENKPTEEERARKREEIRALMRASEQRGRDQGPGLERGR